MQKYCFDRSKTNIVDIYSNLYSTFVDLPTFIRLWDKLAIELNYPIPELMSLDDRLVDLITINNYRCWFDLGGLDMFDSEYEIIEQFDIEYSDIAFERNIRLSTIKDIIDFLIEMIAVKKISTHHDMNTITFEKIKQSQGYQYAKEEGKLEQKIATIILLQELGLSIDDIAKKLKLDRQTVRKNCK